MKPRSVVRPGRYVRISTSTRNRTSHPPSGETSRSAAEEIGDQEYSKPSNPCLNTVSLKIQLSRSVWQTHSPGGHTAWSGDLDTISKFHIEKSHTRSRFTGMSQMLAYITITTEVDGQEAHHDTGVEAEDTAARQCVGIAGFEHPRSV